MIITTEILQTIPKLTKDNGLSKTSWSFSESLEISEQLD